MSTSNKKPVEKGDEYWSFVDSLLDNFDDTKPAAPRPRTPVSEEEREAARARREQRRRAPKVSAEEAAAAVAEATAPVEEVTPVTIPKPVEDTVLPTTRSSTASETEAKSSGEAPPAGGYFLPRANATQAEQAKPKKKRGGFHLSEDFGSVLPVEPAVPVAEPEVPAAEPEIPAFDGPEVHVPTYEAPKFDLPEPEVPVITKLKEPEVELPEAPVYKAPVEPEPEAKPENIYFKTPVAPAAPEEPEEPEEIEEPIAEEVIVEENVPAEVPAEPEDAIVIEAPAEPEEAPLTKAELKARKKAEKQAAKEAKAAEKAAAKEAKEAEKQAEKEAKAAEKAAAKEAKAAKEESFPWEDDSVEHISLEEALGDAPVIDEEKTTLAAAPAAAAVADFDEDARNAEFDATYVEPKKSGGALRVIRNLVIILAALAIVACIAVLGYNFAQQKLNARQFGQASTLLAEGEKAKDLKAVQKKYPEVTFPEDMDPAFGELYAQNQDLVGWVSVDGTGFSYPVVQTKDDSFYQNHNFTKASSPYGTPFLSYKNDAADLDLNNVIYGQNSPKDPRVFGLLEEYRSADYFKKHPVIEYSSLTENYRFKVYGVFVTNSAADQDNGYVFDYTVPNLGTVESFAGYVDQVNQRRFYDTGVDIESSDKLLTLSTSTDDFEGARLVVVGRLIRDEESASIDKSLVKTNKAPRYPQAWYDLQGKENPYDSTDNWIPTIS